MILLAYTKPTGDQGNLSFLQNALNSYKPKQYNDWQYIANQQVENPDFRSMFRNLYQARNTAGNRERAAYQDSKENLTTNRANSVNSAVKRSLAAGLGGAGGGSGLGGYRSQEISEGYQPSFDRLERGHKNNISDINKNYRSGVAQIDAQKENRGLKVASEATRLMQADTQGFRNWQSSLADTIQKYGAEQADLSYKQRQDAFNNQLALQKFDWQKKMDDRPYQETTAAQRMPYEYPSANSLLPYNMGPTPYQQAQLSRSNGGGSNDKSAAYAAAYQAISSNPTVISDPEFIQSFLAAGLTPSDYSALLEMLGQ